MTKRSKSGGVVQTQANSAKPKEIGNEFHVTEMGAHAAPVENVNWVGQEIDVRSDIGFGADLGAGIPIILRQFEFALPKEVPLNQLPAKEKILEYHKDRITAFLWKDELELIQEPKIVMQGHKFKIFATCQARKGSLVSQRPQTLTDVI